MMRYILFTTPTCPNCPVVKEYMHESDVEGEIVDASTPEGLTRAKELEISAVPTVVFFEDDKEIGRANSVDETKNFL